jgi:hypothetical protein
MAAQRQRRCRVCELDGTNIDIALITFAAGCGYVL